MITAIEKSIREELRSEVAKGTGLRFLKYNTPISGTGLGNKVLFFVFVNHSTTPRWIVKTVRTSRDSEVIKNGYNRLKLLNAATANSTFSRMFPQALFLREDGEQIWNAETFSRGRRATHDDLGTIVNSYTDFSKHVRKNSREQIQLDAAYGEKIIKEFKATADVRKKLVAYLRTLWKDQTIHLPKIAQHGDLTVDNVIIQDTEVRIIDCDTYGTIEIPGFDISHLLLRTSPEQRKSGLIEYFKALDIEYTPDTKLMFMYYLHELRIKKDYILVGRAPEAIIAEFEGMVSSKNA